MNKTKLGFGANLVSPMVPILAGTQVDGKPNYLTIAYIGLLCYNTVSISVGYKQYSLKGFEENGTFSVNQPSASMVQKLDYCGLYSGRAFDKSCLFENFYGELETAPMIEECPVNFECQVVQTLDMPAHKVFIGEIKEVYLSPDCITDGFPDCSKIDPVIYHPIFGEPNPKGHYGRLGENLAEVWKIGKQLKP